MVKHGEEPTHFPEIENDESRKQVTQENRSSGLSQVKWAAAILTLAIAVGLGAAFAIPILIQPKSPPNTGINMTKVEPASTLLAIGNIRVKYPDQKVENLVSGMTLDVKPGAEITALQGSAKIQLVDGTLIYISEASVVSLVTLADPKQSGTQTVLTLNSGGVLVEEIRTARGMGAQVRIPGPVGAVAVGQFFGATLVPRQERFDVDCLEGPCRLSAENTAIDLVTGQHTWSENAVLGKVDPIRWDIWAHLCDADCPAFAQIGPVIQLTPTLAPPQQVPIPDAGLSEVEPAPPSAVDQANPSAENSGASNPVSVPPPHLAAPPSPSPTSGSSNPTATPAPPSSAVPPPVAPPTRIPPTRIPPTPAPPTPPGSGSGHPGNSTGGGPGLSKGGKNPPGHQRNGQGGKPGNGNGNGNGHHKPWKK